MLVILLVPGVGSAEPLVGDVFGFGRNVSGKTCLGTDQGAASIATAIDTSNLGTLGLLQVSASGGTLLGYGRHTHLLAEDGSAWACGVNTNNRTGQGTPSGITPTASIIDPVPFGALDITQLSVGGAHSLLLREDGVVFSLGNGGAAQTGLGEAKSALVPTPIDAGQLGQLAVTQVAAGGSHSLVLSELGTVFGFGAGYEGQAGVGTSGVFLSATAIDATNIGQREIVQLSAGDIHSLVLADDGTVFAFGDNADGRTCLGTNTGDTLVPTPIDTTNLGPLAIEQVSAGAQHSLLLAEDGTVFACGTNLSGVTGQGTRMGETLIPTAIDASNLGGRAIAQVAAGVNHSLLRAEDGTVFSFGWHGDGATGLGLTAGEATVATPIDTTNLAGLFVTDISAGFQHSLLVATLPEPSGGGLAAAGALAGLARRRRRVVARGASDRVGPVR
ncbi:MAG: hypothetical protein QNK03_03695 [Myxococcota bacterium]|nr:hypothetical protein [Myxococcota bacterium]